MPQGRVLRTGRPEITPDVQLYENYEYPRLGSARACGIHGTAGVPVFLRGDHGCATAAAGLVFSAHPAAASEHGAPSAPLCRRSIAAACVRRTRARGEHGRGTRSPPSGAAIARAELTAASLLPLGRFSGDHPLAVLEVATPRKDLDWSRLVSGVRRAPTIARGQHSLSQQHPRDVPVVSLPPRAEIRRPPPGSHAGICSLCARPFPSPPLPQLSKALESCNLATGLLPSITTSVPMEYSALSQNMSARLSTLINNACTKYNAALGQAWQMALSEAPCGGDERTVMLQTWGLPSCIVAQDGLESLRTFRAMCCSTPLLLGQGLPGQSLQKGPVDWTGGGAMFRNSTYPLHHFAHAAGLHSGCAIRVRAPLFFQLRSWRIGRPPWPARLVSPHPAAPSRPASRAPSADGGARALDGRAHRLCARVPLPPVGHVPRGDQRDALALPRAPARGGDDGRRDRV